jgi:methanogenic corrinoid protein MtbC1
VRPDLAAELVRARDDIAVAVTDTFLAQHPDWVGRYGERARLRGEEDAGHHIDFLVAAVDIGDPRSFADYARWCRGVLESRGIPAAVLAENLAAIGRELAGHVSPETVNAATAALDAGLAALDAPAEVEPASDEEGLAIARRLYTAAAIAGRRKDALAVVRESLREGGSLLDVYIDIFQESLYEVGRRWASTGLTVAEEHMATATTQFILGVLYEEIPRATMRRGNAVVTGVGDELHQVGANIVADALDADGWDVRFIGTNVPTEGILALLDEHDPTLVGISATIVGNVGRVRDLISDIHHRGDETPRILVGGGAFRAHPDLWRDIGADGFALDVRAAVEVARASSF